MSVDPTLFHRLYVSRVGPETIKQQLSTVPDPQIRFDHKVFYDLLCCSVCFGVPRHFRFILSCKSGNMFSKSVFLYVTEVVSFFFFRAYCVQKLPIAFCNGKMSGLQESYCLFQKFGSTKGT